VGIDELIEAYDKKGLQNDPLYPALLLLVKHRFAEAHDMLARLFEEDSTNLLIADLLVNCCMFLGKAQQALTILHSVLMVDNSWLSGWLLLARVLTFIGDFEGAVDAINKVPVTPYTESAIKEIISETIDRKTSILLETL
jgi:predicted Zn-dependent protease